MKRDRLNLRLATMLAVLFFMSAVASAQVRDMPTIDLNADAKCEVMPDELILSIAVKESDYKGKSTLEDKQKELISVLKANKVDYEKSLSIIQMGSAISVKTYSKKIKTLGEIAYLLKLDNSTTMQRVIEGLESKGISNIKLISTRYTKSEELKTRLGVEAIKKAKLEAEALAGAIDQEIGKAVTISTWMTNNAPRQRPVVMYAQKRSNDVVMEESMPVAEEIPMLSKITYTVTVSVKFELK